MADEPARKAKPLAEGMIRKGGRNSYPSQIVERPPPPGAWHANKRLNERAEIYYQALERISKRHPNAGTTGDIAREALEAAANVQ
jgi:hypothetical protein